MQISNSNDLDLWSSIQFDFMVWGPALNSSSIVPASNLNWINLIKVVQINWRNIQHFFRCFTQSQYSKKIQSKKEVTLLTLYDVLTVYYTVFTVPTVQTSLTVACMPKYIVRKGRLERYWNGVMCFLSKMWGKGRVPIIKMEI